MIDGTWDGCPTGLPDEEIWGMRRLMEEIAGEEYDWDVGPGPRRPSRQARRQAVKKKAPRKKASRKKASRKKASRKKTAPRGLAEVIPIERARGWKGRR